MVSNLFMVVNYFKPFFPRVDNESNNKKLFH